MTLLNPKIDPNYPRDYLKGEIEFLSLKITLKEGVFIPREESEEFVREILKNPSKFWKFKQKSSLLIDLCTGSGVWGLSLSNSFSKTILVDYFRVPLEVARKNLTLNQQKNTSLQKSNLFKAEKLQYLIKNNKNWVLVCNPPYVPLKDRSQVILNKINYEPKEAIFSGLDGLYLFKKTLKQIKLYNLGLPKVCIFELDPRNISKAKNILQKDYQNVVIIPDIYSRPRFLMGYLTN